MKISIVIPVYNEEAQLRACLEAIAAQTITPHEVIVVDNNSTDKSLQVAAGFDFVTLLKESRQGVIHARTRGFNAVTGDIIARIDADSLLAPDWLASVEKVFEDESVDAVSGIALYYNVAAAGFFNALDLFFRRRLSWQLKDRVYLWGSNMAMRSSAWHKVKSVLCNKGDLHEDFDIAIHLQELGGRVVFDENLKARVSSRRIDVSYFSFMRYVRLSPGTYAQHNIKERRHMYPIVFICAVGYLPARLLHRGYDTKSARFSWIKAFSPSSAVPRVDPTANVA